jgi:hypothetical protein
MEIALPGLKNEFDLPAKRVHLDDCCSIPEGRWHIRDQEIPGHERQVGLRWRVAFFLRGLPGYSSAFIDNHLRYTHGNETRGYVRCGPDIDRCLKERAIVLDGRTERGQLHRAPTTSKCCLEVGLMIEATEKRRAHRRHAGQGLDLKIAYITEAQYSFLRPGDDLSDIALRWNVPWCQRKMPQ